MPQLIVLQGANMYVSRISLLRPCIEDSTDTARFESLSSIVTLHITALRRIMMDSTVH